MGAATAVQHDYMGALALRMQQNKGRNGHIGTHLE